MHPRNKNRNRYDLSALVIINPELNVVQLGDYKKTSKFKKHHYYGSLSIHHNNSGNIGLFINKYDIDINNNYDLLYWDRHLFGDFNSNG